MQYFAIAAVAKLTMTVVTLFRIANTVAIADIQAVFRAIAPYRQLHEPRKDFWKARIENACIDVRCKPLQQIGATVLAVASRAIGMVGVKSPQNAAAMQKIVHEAVDHDKARTDREPLATS